MRLWWALVLATATLGLAVPAAQAGDAIMPLSQVHRGQHCTGLTVIRGTDIASFDVEVLDVIAGSTTGEGPRILIRVSGPAVDDTGIAEGFSGSPIYCPDGSGAMLNIGAISEGLADYGNKAGLATPIESILGESARPPTSARSAPRLLRSGRPLAVLTVSGLPSGLARVVTAAAARAGRRLVAAPAAPSTDFPQQTLRPGASMAVGLASGDLSLGAIGTVSYTDGDAVWGFGHPFSGTGARSLLLQDAYVHAVIANPIGAPGLTSYKLAAPGHIVGALSNDTLNAVVGRAGVSPPVIGLQINGLDGDTGATATMNESIPDEADVDTPDGVSPLGLVGTLALSNAGTQLLHGSPARQSGSMCLRLVLRERRKPLGFCNRYISAASDPLAAFSGGVASSAVNDYTTATSLIDNYNFARLHIATVSISLVESRGLHQAFLLAAAGPPAVHRGARIRVRMRIRRRFGAAQIVTGSLRVPRTLAPGLRTLTLRGAPLDSGGEGSLLGILGASPVNPLTGPSPSSATGPRSVEALARAVSAIHRFDGVTGSFDRDAGALFAAKPGLGAPARSETQHVYRDRDLRISGEAKVRLLVLGR